MQFCKSSHNPKPNAFQFRNGFKVKTPDGIGIVLWADEVSDDNPLVGVMVEGWEESQIYYPEDLSLLTL